MATPDDAPTAGASAARRRADHAVATAWLVPAPGIARAPITSAAAEPARAPARPPRRPRRTTPLPLPPSPTPRPTPKARPAAAPTAPATPPWSRSGMSRLSAIWIRNRSKRGDNAHDATRLCFLLVKRPLHD